MPGRVFDHDFRRRRVDRNAATGSYWVSQMVIAIRMFSRMKQLQSLSLLVIGLFILVPGQPVFAADTDGIAKCDKLAAHPDDPYRTA